jgi:hypothetical protein
MTFEPKHVPCREALRIVAERANIKQDQINPLWLALEQKAIIPEIRKDGTWAQPSEGEQLSIWFPNPLVGNYQAPSRDEVSHRDVRFAMADLDSLWPVPTQDAPPRRRPGNPGERREWVLAQMRKLPWTEVEGMKEESMVAQFGTSRGTCREARKILREEHSALSKKKG